MANLFSNRTDRRQKPPSKTADERSADMTVDEQLSSLSAGESSRDVDKAVSEAETAVSAATIADIREMHVVRKGRCPKCGARIEEMLFTSICPMCGWYRQNHAATGHCVFQLTNGTSVACDRFFRVENDQILCIVGDHVICQVARQAVQQINYEWEQEKLDQARSTYQKTKSGICSWCDCMMDALPDPNAPYEEYVAFGAYQERYLFCSKKCMASFRKQYPVRIHRNCYETDCNQCEQCTKRFDTQGFVRMKQEELAGS